MKCPDHSKLARLLEVDSAMGSADSLWEHLESCSRCRTQLDLISDDPELRKWQSKTLNSMQLAGDANAIAELVHQLLDRDTAAESQANKTTIQDHGNDRLIMESFAPSDDPSEIGILGQYRIKRMLGHGGMAIVFEAIDTELDRVVALKILRSSHSDQSSRDRFIREARALAGVKNPNVISIYSVQSNESQQPWIAMEMADGGSLQEMLRMQQDFEPKLAATWIAMVANGLSSVHESGLIHRDIKPSNVLLAKNGGETIAKLADFGLARSISLTNRETQTGVLLGTLAYMSPEHVSAPETCNSRSDIYSLGATLYEMLTGDVPFRGAVHTVLQRIGRDEPTAPRSLNSMIPRDLETICMKAMHREPIKRYLTAKDFADDLKRWIDGQPIQARPASNFEHFVSWCRRNKRVATLAGAVASLLLALAGVSTYFAFTLQAADKSLKKEKDIVEATSQQLEVALEDAKSQRQKAIDSLNELVTKVQAELKQRSGTFKLRESILDVAVRGLDQITEDSDSLDVDLTRVLAYLQKGDIYDSLGRSDASLAEIDRAVLLAESYSKQTPNDPDVKSVLGDALFARADLATRRGAIDLALTLYQRVLSIREDALSSLPENGEDKERFNERKALCMVLGRIGDVFYHRANWEESLAFQTRALKLATTNSFHFPKSPVAMRDLSLTYQRLGTLELLRNHNDIASEHFLKAVDINRSLLVADPENKQYAGDLGFILGELSKLTNAQGDIGTAISQAKESIRQCEKVVSVDPDDTDAQIKAAMSWLQLYWIYFVENKLELAEEAVETFLELNSKLIAQNPTASKFPSLSATWLDKLIDLQVRQGKLEEVIRTNRRLIDSLKLFIKTADSQPKLLLPVISIREKLELGVRLVIDGSDMNNENSNADPDVVYFGRLFAMYEAARTGKLETTIELGQLLARSVSVSPFVQSAGYMTMARAYSLCFGQLSKSSSSNATDVDDKKAMVLEKAIICMTSCFAGQDMGSNPSARSFVLKDPDFGSIQSESSFQSLAQ